MRTQALLFVVLVSTLVLGGVRPACAEAPPPAFIRMHVADELTVVQIAAQVGLVRAWTKSEADYLSEPGPIPRPYAREIHAALAPALEVRIDGAVVPAVFSGGRVDPYEDDGRTWLYARIEVHVATKVPPRQVEVVWQRYADDTDFRFEHIDVELDAYDDMLELRLTPEEPSYIWHRPADMPPIVPVARPTTTVATPLDVPALSIAALVGALMLVFLRRRRLNAQARLTTIGLGLLVGMVLLPFGRLDLRPWLGGAAPTIERPPDDEALAIFASLHSGLYEAMQLQGEEAVYDALAPIVTAEFLPRLYLETRQSMIMSAQGGAVAQIDRTDLLETALQPPTEGDTAPWFVVRAHWRVEGSVGHWGHSHERRNEYTADVTVIAIGTRWKIAAVETLELRRIDDGQEAQPGGGSPADPSGR